MARQDVKKRLDREKNIYAELVMKRMSLDQELDELNTECRQNARDSAGPCARSTWKARAVGWVGQARPSDGA